MAKTLEPIPAANERSPNRKPRYKSVILKDLRKQEQDTFLRVYRETGNFDIACAAIQRPRWLVYQWAQKKPLFLERWHQAKLLWQALRQPRIDDLTEKSLDIVGQTLNRQEADPKLAFDAAQTHLKGVGVYKAKHELTGEGGGPILIKEVEVRLSGNSNGG